MPMSWMGRGWGGGGVGGITNRKDISVPRKKFKYLTYQKNIPLSQQQNSDIAKKIRYCKKIFKYLTYQKNIPVSPHRCTGRTSSASRREIYTSPGAKAKDIKFETS